MEKVRLEQRSPDSPEGIRKGIRKGKVKKSVLAAKEPETKMGQAGDAVVHFSGKTSVLVQNY